MDETLFDLLDSGEIVHWTGISSDSQWHFVITDQRIALINSRKTEILSDLTYREMDSVIQVDADARSILIRARPAAEIMFQPEALPSAMLVTGIGILRQKGDLKIDKLDDVDAPVAMLAETYQAATGQELMLLSS